MKTLSAVIIACALAHGATPVCAQQIPIRQLGAASAVSRDPIGYLYGLRELADGRLVANDATGRRLMLFDRELAHAKVIADSSAASDSPYGRSATGIIPYTGDSTLLIDGVARVFLVFDGKGEVVRVMSPPRPGDVGFMANPGFGAPRFDALGRLVYRVMVMPHFAAPEAGKPFVAPNMPDSAPILRGDFDKRNVDTIAWVRTAKMRITSQPIAGGGVRMSPMINPLATIDDWAMLPDGTIAILRGIDYHIDWINADGTRASSPKMPFDWKRLSEAEKAAIVDSTKAGLERDARAGNVVNPFAGTGRDASGMPSGHSMTILPVAGADGGPPPKTPTPAPSGPQVPEVVPPSDLPDYMPAILRAGTMRVDDRGNIWILPSTSTQAGVGLVYDVINRKGEIFERVRLPAGRALEGFGAGGAVFVSSHEGGVASLERRRVE